MLRHNVIYVDTICLCGLHGWSSESHQEHQERIISIALRECSYKGACIPAFAPCFFHHHGDYLSAEKNCSCQASPIIFSHLYNIYLCNRLSAFAAIFSYILYSVFLSSVRCRLYSFITDSTHLDHRFPLHEPAQFKWHGVGGRTVEKTIRCDLHLVKSFTPHIVILQFGTNDRSHLDPSVAASAIEDSLQRAYCASNLCLPNA